MLHQAEFLALAGRLFSEKANIRNRQSDYTLLLFILSSFKNEGENVSVGSAQAAAKNFSPYADCGYGSHLYIIRCKNLLSISE